MRSFPYLISGFISSRQTEVRTALARYTATFRKRNRTIVFRTMIANPLYVRFILAAADTSRRAKLRCSGSVIRVRSPRHDALLEVAWLPECGRRASPPIVRKVSTESLHRFL